MHDVAKPERLRRGERIGGRRHEVHLLLLLSADFELWVVNMRVESKDEVGLVLAQHTEHPLGIRLCDGQADLGKAPLKVDEIIVEIPGADRA